MKNWKYPFLLLAGIGVSYLGNWIYLIAINLSILDLTGSAAAVAGLYVIRPIAILITNTWAGSVIDRVNKRKLMIGVDVVRGLLVFLIPFIGSLWVIYFLLLLINIAGAFFGPSSSVYITKLIPASDRKRFNSLMSMTSSGAFLLGPAIAGVLIMLVGTELCIFINSATFLVCAFFIYLLPDVDEVVKEKRERVTWSMLVGDWRIVKRFAQGATYFMVVYLLFQGAMLTGFALDSQEVTFIKQHLLLTDQDYGLIVSLTGLGALAGAAVAAMVANRVPLRVYIGGGMLFTSVGYLLFYASFSFWTATLAFVFLGFFMAFANAGYATFFQQCVPVEIMGRFGSLAEMLQAIVQIVLTLILGVAADWFTIQTACMVFSFAGVVLAMVLFITVLLPSKQIHFNEGKLEA
ncbi:MFS transporter [Bacillus haimaensis]|uniref:MFS transporter n=1 Tax=Bacillus haimaensis TaxID=3160967 RepID=UPI003AA858B2